MNKDIYGQLRIELEHGRKALVATSLNDFSKRLAGEGDVTVEGLSDIDKVMEKGEPVLLEEEGFLLEPYFPEPRLIIFGGGHIGKPLCEYAKRAGFGITVVDDRPSFANKGRFPDANRVICESFEKAFDLIDINSSVFVVIVTRGHRHDILCLRQVLGKKAAYVGMIGSRRRVRNTRELLLEEGYDKEEVEGLKAPIGLDIGAVTPDEIAFSIIAQLIRERRAGMERNFNWPEFDGDVLTELSRDGESRRAMATIISTKGSVPRKAGAKMLVYEDGRIVGSIGGGCSEGEVILSARRIIKEGGYLVQRVDMTGDIAEEEGMSCGGIMDVLIEPLSW